MPRPSIALASLLVALGGVGCGEKKTTSETQSSLSCAGSECDITLSGDGAKTDVKGLTITLDGTDGDKATLKVAPTDGGKDETLELKTGESGDAFGARIKLQRVDGSEVDVHTAPR